MLLQNYHTAKPRMIISPCYPKTLKGCSLQGGYPVFHRLRERIEAHICISFVSYVLFKDLERVLLLNSNISVKKAIKAINKMYEIIVRMPEDRAHTIKLKNNKVQQQIVELIEAKF